MAIRQARIAASRSAAGCRGVTRADEGRSRSRAPTGNGVALEVGNSIEELCLFFCLKERSPHRRWPCHGRCANPHQREGTMAETLALAIGVPGALGAAWLASRRSWSPAAADNRGIALQTVIVIVVLLVIAGGVAAVLLTRGSEVIGDLEAQDIGIGITAENCAGQTLNGRNGVPTGTPATTCVFADANAAANDISSAACRNLRNADGGRGVFSEPSNVNTCTVTFA